MRETEPRGEQRTELVVRLERPTSPTPTAADSEPRTALFRNPDFVQDAGDLETAQMSALLGGALSAQRALPPPPARRRAGFRWRLWLGRLLLGSVLGTFIMAIVALALTGVAERARADAKDQARLLQELLLQGSLTEAAQHLDRLEKLLAEARRPTAFAALRARTEATLYRFHDALPDRRARAEALVQDASEHGSSDAWMARTLLASPDERARLLEGKDALAMTRDAYPVALSAAQAARRGRVEEARSGYERAEALEPSNLVHLYGLFLAERWAGNARAAQLVLERLEDASPNGPWTRLARAQSAEDEEARGAALAVVAEAPETPPVVRALASELFLSSPAAGLDPERQARVAALARDAVRGDDRFLLELPLPPRLTRSAEPEPSAATIVTREISITLDPPEKAPAKKARRKPRRTKRAR